MSKRNKPTIGFDSKENQFFEIDNFENERIRITIIPTKSKKDPKKYTEEPCLRINKVVYNTESGKMKVIMGPEILKSSAKEFIEMIQKAYELS